MGETRILEQFIVEAMGVLASRDIITSRMVDLVKTLAFQVQRIRSNLSSYN